MRIFKGIQEAVGKPLTNRVFLVKKQDLVEVVEQYKKVNNIRVCMRDIDVADAKLYERNVEIAHAAGLEFVEGTGPRGKGTGSFWLQELRPVYEGS